VYIHNWISSFVQRHTFFPTLKSPPSPQATTHHATSTGAGDDDTHVNDYDEDDGYKDGDDNNKNDDYIGPGYKRDEDDDNDRNYHTIEMPEEHLVVFSHVYRDLAKVTKVYYLGDDATNYVLFKTKEYFFGDMAVADNAPATQWTKVAKAVVDAVAKAATKAAAQPPGSLVRVEYPSMPIPDGVSFTGVEDGVQVDVGGLVGGLVGFQPEPGSVTHGSSLGRTFTVRGTLYYYGRSATKIHRRLATHMHWSEAATVTLQSFMTYSATRRMMEKLVVG
jgi:hypothetical protein